MKEKTIYYVVELELQGLDCNDSYQETTGNKRVRVYFIDDNILLEMVTIECSIESNSEEEINLFISESNNSISYLDSNDKYKLVLL